MDDLQILGLFLDRSEEAVTELKKKYGRQSMTVAARILGNVHDAEECVNDAYQVIWEQVPPDEPKNLWAYFSRIVRNLSYTRLDHLTAAVRDQRCQVCLSELEGCLAVGQDPEEILESKRISETINAFLATLDKTNRFIFMRRYYYMDSCAVIGKWLGLSRGAVHNRLLHMQSKLQKTLEKEEIYW